ncbi:hypothetical protein [Streptomyces sp. NPDC005989]|uniref:hypothetical protein n=1 Tax=Streptomyces sp. NPDC005989 TaxID=3156727 RepID=UPI0033F77A34
MVNDDANHDNCQEGQTDKPTQHCRFLRMGSVSAILERLFSICDAIVDIGCGRVICELFSRLPHESG